MDTQCRICYESTSTPLIRPCRCKGTMEWVHTSCLMDWIESPSADKMRCDVCRARYVRDAYHTPWYITAAFILVLFWAMLQLVVCVSLFFQDSPFQWFTWTQFPVIWMGFYGSPLSALWLGRERVLRAPISSFMFTAYWLYNKDRIMLSFWMLVGTLRGVLHGCEWCLGEAIRRYALMPPKHRDWS